MAKRAKENLPGGSRKYLKEKRIFTCSYRIYVCPYVGAII